MHYVILSLVTPVLVGGASGGELGRGEGTWKWALRSCVEGKATTLKIVSLLFSFLIVGWCGVTNMGDMNKYLSFQFILDKIYSPS